LVGRDEGTEGGGRLMKVMVLEEREGNQADVLFPNFDFFVSEMGMNPTH